MQTSRSERVDGLRVYVAGPLSSGDWFANVRAALDAADQLKALGHWPYVPHLTAFWHMIYPRPHDEWMRLDMVWLAQCDALVRLPGRSRGADAEVAQAHELGLPVHLSVEDFQFDRRVSRGVPKLMATAEALKQIQKATDTYAPYLGTVDIDAPFGGKCFHCWVDGQCKTCGAERPVPGPAAPFGAGRVLSACPTRVRRVSDTDTEKDTAKAVSGRVLRTMLAKVLKEQKALGERVKLLEVAHKTWAAETDLHRRRLDVIEGLDHEKAEELERLADEVKLMVEQVEILTGWKEADGERLKAFNATLNRLERRVYGPGAA